MIKYENKHLRRMLCILSIISITTVCISSRLENLLFQAVTDNNVKGAFTLLKHHKINPNISSSCGATPLHFAARRGHLGMIKLLKQFNANIEARDNWGNTPIRYAIREKQLPAIFEFIDNWHADINSQDDCGSTPLHCAAYHNNAEAISLLLHSGANHFSTNNRGLTAYELALKRGNLKAAHEFETYFTELLVLRMGEMVLREDTTI